jgi:hypothetical protein
MLYIAAQYKANIHLGSCSKTALVSATSRDVLKTSGGQKNSLLSFPPSHSAEV